MSENPEWDGKLPDRLFATDRFPNGRLNVYSKVDILVFLSQQLRGSEELEIIRRSPFGKLFELDAAKCEISCKLIHGLLTRQLLMKKRFVLWTVFGGQPMRFSLAEFGAITGLPCGEFEEGYKHDYQLPAKDESYVYWEKLIGPNRQTTLADIVEMIKKQPNMESWRRIRLALILIVDGVLIASTQAPKPSTKYVKLVEDLDAFMSFPWGRESFLWTISSMRPAAKIIGKCEDPVGTYRDYLRQSTFRLLGFPLVLQLVALDAIPALCAKLGGRKGVVTLLEFAEEKLPKSTGLSMSDVVDVEFDSKLVVKAIMDVEIPEEEGWGEWDNEFRDKKVEYMEQLISAGHVFKRCEWPGGDASCPLAVRKKQKDVGEKNKGKKTVGVDKQHAGVKKQRRVSGYFRKGAKDNQVDYSWLVGRVVELTEEVRKLKERAEKEDKKRKVKKQTRGIGKFSSQRRSARKRKYREAVEEKGVEGTTGDESYDEGDYPGIISLKEGVDVPVQWIEGYIHSPSSTTVGIGNEVQGDVGSGINMSEEDGDDDQAEEHSGEGLVDNEDQASIDRCIANIVEQHEKNQKSVDMEEDNTEMKDEAMDHRGSCVQAFVDDEGEKAADMEEEKVGTKEEAKDVDVGASGQVGVVKGNKEDVEAEGEKVETEGSETTKGEDVIVELSDSSPAKKPPKNTRMEGEVVLDVLLARKGPYTAEMLVPRFEDPAYALFEQTLLAAPKTLHITGGKYDLTNEFFLDLATPTKWVSTLHMKVLMDFLGARHAGILKTERACFVSPWFTSYLQGKERSFNAAIKKERVFADKRLKQLVMMSGQTWVEDVDTLYVPMIWDNSHWVGLSINLEVWSIEVLDPFPSLKSLEKVDRYMSPVVKMLPFIIRHLCPPRATQTHGLKPFVWKRLSGLYENLRSGDCGPVAVKFMEIHANYDAEPGMGGLNDNLVDIFRKQYAVDIYKELVVPLYCN